MFRETPNKNFEIAHRSLKAALEELIDRHKHILAHAWMHKVLCAFKQQTQELILKDKNKAINLKQILLPAPGRIAAHEQELIPFCRNTFSSQQISAGVIIS